VKLVKRESQELTAFLDQLVAAEKKESRVSLANLFKAQLDLPGLTVLLEKMVEKASLGLKVQQD